MQNIRHFWASIRPNGPKRPHILDRLELRICDYVSDIDLLLAITALLELRVIYLFENLKTLDPLINSKFSMEQLTKASMRQVKWLSNAKSKVLKDIQKDVEKTRKKVIQEETNKIEKEKLYQVQAFLKRGEFVNDQGERVVAGSGNKIEIASLKNLVPFYDMATEIKKLRTGKYGMVAKEGMPVSVVAEMFGFNDPVEMINALVDMRPMKEVVMERTDQRMLN